MTEPAADPHADFKGTKPVEERHKLDDVALNAWMKSNVEGYAGPLTIANHLGNVAYRTGKKILWDGKANKVTNTTEADRFLGREPRAGWKLG